MSEPKVLLEFDPPTGGHWRVAERFGKRAMDFRMSDYDEWCEAFGDYRFPLGVYDALSARLAAVEAERDALLAERDEAMEICDRRTDFVNFVGRLAALRARIASREGRR